MKPDELPKARQSPIQLFITIIAAIFMAEVIAMIAVYLIQPIPYSLVTLLDAGIMTILIFPVLYFLSFRPLLRHIEERRQAEESLLRSRQLQEKFFDSMDTLIAYMDQGFNFIRVNDAFARADGRQPEDFIGKNHFDLYPDLENRASFQRVVESGEPYWVNERPFTYPDHPERGILYWDLRLQPVKGSNGAVEGLVLSMLNVTERKRAQEAVQQLSRIVEQTEDSVVVTDCDGIIEYVNPAFSRLTGYTSEEAVGLTPRFLKSGLHDKGFYETLWNTILSSQVFQGEIANRKKDGELFYEVKTITPLRDAYGEITHFVATGKDITEHKQHEEQLQKAYVELELRVKERTEELRLANSSLEEEINIRRQTEQALRASEFGLKRAQEIAHLGNWELDLIKNRLTWSDEVYRIFGLQPQEFRASYEAFLEMVHPDDRAAVDRAYSSSIVDGKDGYEIEHRVIRPSSGEVRVLHEKCEHIRNESGEIIRSVGMVHDITERKRAEEQLRYQAALLSNVNDAIIASDSQFRLTAWNSGAESLYGWKAEEILGRNGLEVVRTEWPEKDPEEMRRTIEETGRWRGEATQVRKDGSRFPVEVSSMVLRDDAGQVTGYISVNRDITERKHAEELLQQIYAGLELRVEERTEELAAANLELRKEIAERKEIERQLRIQAAAMEAAANGIVITDRLGTIQWANPALFHISGYEASDLLGQNMHIFKSGQHNEAYYREMWGAILSGEVWRGEITNRRKDGSCYTEEQTITPVRDEQGQIAQFIAVKQDVSERKRAEAALRQSEEKFRTLVEWTYDWEFWVDPDGHLIYTSPACKRITGFSPEEFIADPELMISIIHAKDRSLVMKHHQAVHNEAAGIEKIEYRIITRDGKEYWIEHICRPLFDAENRYVGRRVSNRDITERKQAEKVIRERNQKEKLLLQTIHTMQLDIARDLHDTLGQNIGFLRMKLDYLADKKITKRAEMQMELRSMAQAANESYDLMRGMLAVLQSENSTDLFRLFSRYAERIEERSPFTIKFLNQGEPRFMSAKRMRQLFYIFREILNNIEKHADATEVSMEMRWDQDCLGLFVFDNGRGFDLDKIQYGGHYGLKFMKDRAELLNGSLTIESTVGSGTRVQLQVPYE